MTCLSTSSFAVHTSAALRRDSMVMIAVAVTFAAVAAVMPMERWPGAALVAALTLWQTTLGDWV